MVSRILLTVYLLCLTVIVLDPAVNLLWVTVNLLFMWTKNDVITWDFAIK